MNRIFFTIITATYNVEKVFPRLLRSLALQRCRDFELIVQDGNSTDGTSDIFEHWSSEIPNASFASQRDTGIYDAWNKALPRIKGQWVLFLGADDELAHPHVLAQAKECLLHSPSRTQYGVGHLRMLYEDGTFYRDIPAQAETALKNMPYAFPVGHPALFHKNQLFTKKKFDTSYKIAGDYEFLVSTWRHALDGHSMNILVSYMYLGGCSNDANNYSLLRLENARIIGKYYPFKRYPIIRLKRILSLQYIWNVANPAIRFIKKHMMKTLIGKYIWKQMQRVRRNMFTV